MCWNETASLSAFITGIIICLSVGSISYYQKKYELMALSIGWIYVIFMQFWEFLIWKFPNNKFYVDMTYLFNITQISLLGLIFLTFFTNQPKICRFFIFFVLTFYICFFSYQTCNHNDITHQSGHLEYNWWSNSYSSYIYIFSLIFIFLCIIRPFWWSAGTLLIILLFLLLSKIFYSKSVASMWCFFAVSVPLFSFFISLLTY